MIEDKEIDLSVRIANIVLRNPIILSPGPFGRIPLSMKIFADAGCAAVASKTLSSKSRKGNPNPKRMRLPSGWMLHAEGTPNIGIKAFSRRMKKIMNQIKDSYVIISVVGRTIEEFVSLAIEAERMGASILDLEISSPNMDGKGKKDSWQKDLGLLFDLVSTVKKAVTIPLWIKFISAYGTLIRIAETLERAGADAIVPFASVGAMAIGIETGRPLLSFRHGVGVATGPPLKYAELKAVADVCRTVKIPVIASGGCYSGLDIIEYVMAGAKAVQMHTVFLNEGLKHVDRMICEITDFMRRKGWGRIEELCGLTLKYLPGGPLSAWYQGI